MGSLESCFVIGIEFQDLWLNLLRKLVIAEQARPQAPGTLQVVQMHGAGMILIHDPFAPFPFVLDMRQYLAISEPVVENLYK